MIGDPTQPTHQQHNVSLRSPLIFGRFFGLSTLGTASCSSGKLVKLTGLREFGQIMRPYEQHLNFSYKSGLRLLASKSNNLTYATAHQCSIG